MSKAFDHKNIDAIIHSRIRLSILGLLATVDETDFNSLLKEVNTTKGNLSVHLSKLETTGYIKIQKQFVGKIPQTTCSITETGLSAFKEYLDMVEELARRTIK
ncbi:MAG: transcriptional regulator [Melioribacteraceae bacterium]|nr:transcriptional regulator [Melioribacteraceae bacterium]MCF8264729.1 transcriptional regulator [Melioribacteraceae bacterium]